QAVGGGIDRAVFLAATLALLAGGVLAAISVVLRIRRAAVRGPLVWAAVTAGLFVVGLVLDAVEGVPAAWLAGVLAVPVATAVGVLRYGLYDVGLLMHRGLLYGVLTVAAILLYTGAVTATTWLAPGAATPAAAAVTTVVLLPLRQRMQSGLQRLLYGRHPYEVVTGVGRSTSLETVAGELAAGLRAPYVALRAGDARAAYGERRTWPVTTIPLAGDGELLVQQRGPDEPWTRRDRDLLADLAHQLGPVVQAVLLRRDLRSANELAEETRRLRRDLHDGLGPALFGARMLVRAGRARTPGDVVTAWDELDSELAAATAEVRRILTGLGPAALDRGLPAALDALARRHRSGPLDVRLNLAGDLAGLPAAVETAAYRIVDECLTNVGRHAGARTATVTVDRDGDRLRIAVLDDGVGFTAERPGGIGLASMRERCRQLGGTFSVTARSPGTTVHADLAVG
ncbi:MAG: ATP-binding protein, partial [Actinoplanes sp.]